MAVYTHLSRDEIADFIAQYDIGGLESFTGITEGVTNTNYLVNTAQDRFILTLFEKRFELADLPYFVALMEWWSARGIDCPRPIKNREGRALAALSGKPAIVTSFLHGEAVKTITPDHVRELGGLAANMHVAGMDFPHRRANGLSLPAWEAIIDDIAPRADEIMPGLKRLISEEYNELSECWPSGLPAGPVHADLFPDNVFFDRKRKITGVIDLYFSCHDFWAYDLAICVNAWCFDAKGRLAPERVAALMAGYNDVRPMTPEEEAAFPLLLRGAALRFLLTRSQDWLVGKGSADIVLKDPMEYVGKLEFFRSQAR